MSGKMKNVKHISARTIHIVYEWIADRNTFNLKAANHEVSSPLNVYFHI